MLGDSIKIAAKTVAILGISTLIIGLFALIEIPSINYLAFADYLNLAYTVAVHFIPGFSTIFTIALVILDLDLSVYIVEFSIIGVRSVLTLFE